MNAINFEKKVPAFFVFFLILILLSLPANGAVPASPAGLTAIAGNSEASLTWTPVSGATDYVLYRVSAIGGPPTFVAQTQGTSHTNRSVDRNPLSNGTPYYYVVTALNADGQSTYSTQVGVTPTPTVLKAPDGVTAMSGNAEVSLVWNPVTSAVSYNVLRATSRGGPYTLLAPAAPGPIFTDREATNDIQYFYVVQTMSLSLGLYSEAVGAYSEEVSATPSALLPSAPTSLIASPGSTWAGLSWSASLGATTYVVYRWDNNAGPYSFAAQPNTLAYEDMGLSNETTYYYVVAAVNAHGRGAFSAQASASVSAVEKPHATSIYTTEAGDQRASISWETGGWPSGALSYTVRRSTTSGGAYESLRIFGITELAYYSDIGLTNGITYYYVVDTHNGSDTIARSNEVAVTPVAQLPAPTNVAVVAGNTQATVTWDPCVGNNSCDATAATSPGGADISGLYGVGVSCGKLSCTFTGLTNGQVYYFRVRTYSRSAYSAEVSATPSAALPLAPTGLGSRIGNTQISLTWTAVSGATSYKIYRRTEGSPWPAAPVAISTGTLFTDTELVNGTEYYNGTDYYYSVAAVNADGTGARSNLVHAHPIARASGLAPTKVAVVAGNTEATVTVDAVVGADVGYGVIAATSPGGQFVSSGLCHERSCTLAGLTNGQIYYFRVSASSAYATEVSTTPLATLPRAPTNLLLTPGNTQMSLTWTAVSGATSYKIYRTTEGSPWSAVPVGTSTSTIFTDTGLVNGTKYYYSVAAVNAGGTGARAQVAGKTPAATMTLAPTNVAVVAGNTQATLTWDPVVGSRTSYVTAATSPGGPESGSCRAYGQASCRFTGLTNGQIYFFRVRSDAPSSVYSAEVSTTPSAALPLAPTGLGLSPGNTEMRLTWTAVSGATSYKIYRRKEGSPWSVAPIGTSTGTLFTDSELVNGMKYYYSVAAVNAGGTGAWSDEGYNTPDATKTLAPIIVAAVAGNTQVTLTWDSIKGATIYYIAVATSPGGVALSASSMSYGTSYTATGLANGQTYFFRVRVALPSPGSAYSAEVSATPSSPPNTDTISWYFASGWNLIGNSSTGSLDVATALGDATEVITVWKWIADAAKWAFYAPSLAGQALSDYAASKGYDVLTTIYGGEGFWVNAKTTFIAPLPAGTAIASISFQTMGSGWNLIAIGDNRTPDQFNALACAATPLTTLWAWDATQTKWYFYAPSLATAGTLSSYVISKNYLEFGTKTLDPAMGFWVNKP